MFFFTITKNNVVSVDGKNDFLYILSFDWSISWVQENVRRLISSLKSQTSPHSVGVQESAEASPQRLAENESPEAFDPSKLYAKIKIDRYYERLWKACQAAKCGLSPLTESSARKIYYLLGDHKPPQNDQEEEFLQIWAIGCMSRFETFWAGIIIFSILPF